MMFGCHRRKEQAGFTLIELLIVIAIILILIAIALPNFLEAQIRARVTRVKSEFRTIETAMESYRQDWPTYPLRGVNTGGMFVQFITELTSPNQYLTTVDFPDLFIEGGNLPPDPVLSFLTPTSYQYVPYEYFGPTFWNSNGAPYNEAFEAYSLASWGPDTRNSGVNNVPLIERAEGWHPENWGNYDGMFYAPTNGTRSAGDLCFVSNGSSAPVSTRYCR